MEKSKSAVRNMSEVYEKPTIVSEGKLRLDVVMSGMTGLTGMTTIALPPYT